MDFDELITSDNYAEIMQDLTPELKIIFTDILEDLCEDGFVPNVDSDEDIMSYIDWHFDDMEYSPMRKEVMLDNIKYVINN